MAAELLTLLPRTHAAVLKHRPPSTLPARCPHDRALDCRDALGRLSPRSSSQHGHLERPCTKLPANAARASRVWDRDTAVLTERYCPCLDEKAYDEVGVVGRRAAGRVSQI